MNIREGFEKILNTITEEQMRRILVENDKKELFQCHPLVYIKDYRHIEYYQPTYHKVHREDFILFSEDPKLIIPLPELSFEVGSDIVLLILEREISVFDFHNRKEIGRISIPSWSRIKKIDKYLFIHDFQEYRILSICFSEGKIVSKHVGNLMNLTSRNELQPFLTNGCLLGDQIYTTNGKFVEKIDTFFQSKVYHGDEIKDSLDLTFKTFLNKQIVSLKDANNSQFLIYDRNAYKLIVVDLLSGDAKILHEITGVYILEPLDNYVIAKQTFYYKSGGISNICTEYNGQYFLSAQIACDKVEYVSDDIFCAGSILYMRTKWNGFTSIGTLFRTRETQDKKIYPLIVSKKERDRIRDKLGEYLNISTNLLGVISMYL